MSNTDNYLKDHPWKDWIRPDYTSCPYINITIKDKQTFYNGKKCTRKENYWTWCYIGKHYFRKCVKLFKICKQKLPKPTISLFLLYSYIAVCHIARNSWLLRLTINTTSARPTSACIVLDIIRMSIKLCYNCNFHVRTDETIRSDSFVNINCKDFFWEIGIKCLIFYFQWSFSLNLCI